MFFLLRKNCLFCLFTLCFFVVTGVVVQAVEPDIFEQPVTLKFHNNELEVILKKLSDESGIQIIYDKRMSKNKVSGAYENEPFKTVIQRLLGGLSYILTMDRQNRTMLVEGFGETHYVTSRTIEGGAYLADIEVSISELKALYKEQHEEFVKEISDMGAFVEEVGMTRGELKAMHDEQLVDFNREQDNEATVLPELGMTVGEHRALLADQNKEFEKQQNDDAEYLPELGMTRGEHKLMFARQLKDFQQMLD